MKTIRLMALLLLVLFSALVIYSLILPEKMQIREHLTLEAPAAVIWARIRLENNRELWQDGFLLEKTGDGQTFRLLINALHVEQPVLLLTDDHSMIWRLQAVENPHAAPGHAVELALQLNELPDGSTEAEFMVTEAIDPLFSKIFLHVFRSRQWQTFLGQNLTALQRSLG